MRVRSANASAGFTLMEVLLASVLLAIISMLLFGTLRVNISLWDRGEEKTLQTSRMMVVQNFLRRQMTQAVPLMDTNVDGNRYLRFSGSRQQIDYIGLLPHNIRGGLYHLHLYLKALDSGSELRLAVFTLGADYLRDAPVDDVLLMDQVEVFEVAFLFQEMDDVQAERWMDLWQQGSMPKLVRIRIKALGEPYWPDIVARPMGRVMQ
ncbi:MAG: hypothetical protein RIQ52_209 [Pseudomonadota bacterium]